MKALVTGGSGFIGSHVVNELLNKDVSVRIFDRVDPEHHIIDNEWIQFYRGDLNDLEAVRAALTGVDVVFHLAAVADVNDVFDDPYRAERINTGGTVNVLEAIRRGKHKRRMVYISTSWVYSDVNLVVACSEKTLIPPPSHFYTATKYAGELYCQSYANLYDVEYTILRYGIPYGPGARGSTVVSAFTKKALDGETITISGDGSQYRKFVYVKDLAEGTVLAGLSETADNEIYNLDGIEKITIKQIVDELQEILWKTHGMLEVEFTEARVGDFSGKEIFIDKAKNELGWEPKTKFKDGLRKYVEWYKSLSA